MRVNLASLPTPPKERVIDFPRLDGGLNTWEVDYRINANESPDMVNLWWQDGVLCSRNGQTFATDDESLGKGWSAYETLYWDNAFFHIGDKFYCAPLTNPDVHTGDIALREIFSGVPENKGTWFRYGDSLYYKNRGGYFVITYQENGSFKAGTVETYSPIIQINTEPTTAAGDTYQPENRINPQKTVWYSTESGVKEYHLPVQDVDSVDLVTVDDVEWYPEGAEDAPDGAKFYKADLDTGVITFVTEEPEHHNPVRANTVKITYTKANENAMNSIMDCCYATVYGGEQNICVVLGGCPAQPNAYFWCGNHIVMDPGYFPMEQYNFAGDTEDHITGFGKQQAMLVIFKENSIGRAAMGTVAMQSGRTLITMDYTAINSRIGCDLPGSIQLVENNLVFANTQRGVHIVRDSSAAYENNIACISRKVENGLLPTLRGAEVVASYDDGTRYWILADGEVYAWDYTLSGYGDPVWFYFENIHAVAFVTAVQTPYHLDGQGRITVMRKNFQDYGGPIRKRYRFATQYMGGYDYLKDVLSCIFVVRGDADTVIDITYETDYEKRRDMTPIASSTWRLFPRNLEQRCLGFRRFATVARRRPGCRHVRHFAMELENNKTGMDMAVISAQVFYRYQGRDR